MTYWTPIAGGLMVAFGAVRVFGAIRDFFE